MSTPVPTRFFRLLVLALAASGYALSQAASPPTAWSGEQQAAAAAARQALGPAAAGYSVRSVEPRQWPDSSLGCPRPDMMYQQVITDGFVVLLEGGGQVHEVHVAGDNAVVCPARPGTGSPRRPERSALRVTHLPAMERQALQDLARRLGVEEGTIQIVERVPQHWTQAQFQCQQDSAAAVGQAATVSGLRLILRQQGRNYTYHTDMRSVLPCPPIEVQ